MVYIALAFIVATGLFAGMRIWLREKPVSLQQFFILYVLAMVGIFLLVMGLTGRLHWLFVILGAALPFLSKLIGVVITAWRSRGMLNSLRDFLRQMSGIKTDSKRQTQANRQSSTMSRQDALDILGLQGHPTVDEIKAAHRQLIQKIHPDRGGSTLLAKQVNEAKQVLLDDV